jgi:hypothetical protein
MLQWKTWYTGSSIEGGVRKIWSGKLHHPTPTVRCTDDYKRGVSLRNFVD